MKPDSPKETAYLERAKVWEGLINWCERLEGEEIEAEVGRACPDHVREVSSFSDPGGAPALKRPKTGWPRKGSQANQKLLLKGMTRAVARDLGLI
jgi:hypothetical protein